MTGLWPAWWPDPNPRDRLAALEREIGAPGFWQRPDCIDICKAHAHLTRETGATSMPTPADEVMAHVQTYGERIEELEGRVRFWRSVALAAWLIWLVVILAVAT